MGNIVNLFKEENTMPTVFDLARCFLNIESMTHKKLQKLCYYAQAWYLALNNDRLVNTNFEAWIHGPVCPELYHYFRSYGYDKIPKINQIPEDLQNDSYILSFIHQIYDIYGNLSGNDLEELSHTEYPWLNARNNLQSWQSSNNIISDEDMRHYYSNKYCVED